MIQEAGLLTPLAVSHRRLPQGQDWVEMKGPNLQVLVPDTVQAVECATVGPRHPQSQTLSEQSSHASAILDMLLRPSSEAGTPTHVSLIQEQVLSACSMPGTVPESPALMELTRMWGDIHKKQKYIV